MAKSDDFLKPAALTTVGYSIDLLEELDYKYLVLRLLSDKNQANLLMCELRMVLFVAAARHENQEQCLMPFPACFFDRVQKCKDFDRLLKHIDEIPRLRDIDERTQLENLTWKLLHWVFTNPLTLKPLVSNIPEKIKELETTTGLRFPMANPDNKHIFMFNIDQTQPKKKFLDAKAEFGSTFFAFHGSPLKNFHSIILRGLVSALNVRSAHGFGTYMSNDLNTSKSYCSHYSYNPNTNGTGWSKSAFGSAVQCVAICEVIEHPDVKKHAVGPSNYYVCSNDDFMQLSHLLLFS